MRRIAIVGFGLIGGSLALALRRSGGIHVTAIDRARTPNESVRSNEVTATAP